MLTVQEIIDALMAIEDKTMPVKIYNTTTMKCYDVEGIDESDAIVDFNFKEK